MRRGLSGWCSRGRRLGRWLRWGPVDGGKKKIFSRMFGEGRRRGGEKRWEGETYGGDYGSDEGLRISKGEEDGDDLSVGIVGCGGGGGEERRGDDEQDR